MRSRLLDPRMQACLALLLMVVLGSAWMPASPHLTLVNPFAQPENCTNCSSCIGGHSAPLEAGGQLGGLHSWCMELVGCSGHPSCGASLATGSGDVNDDRYQLLLDEFLDGDQDKIAALIEEFPERVSVNLARSAVQFVGCNEETIAASVPLSHAETAKLAATTRPSTDLALR